MSMLSKWPVRWQLASVIAVAIAGVLAVSAFNYRVLERLRIDGPIYHELIREKDVLADILPPPLYVVETWLECKTALLPDSAPSIDAHAERVATLRRDFEARWLHWRTELAGDPGLLLMRDGLVPPAERLFELAIDRYFPALRAGRIEEARQLLNGEMTAAYGEHRQGVDALVQEATAHYEDHVSKAKAELGAAGWWTVGSIVGVSGGVALVAWLIGRGITRRLGMVLSRMENIASGGGDLATRVVEVDGQDEVARLARAFNAFADTVQTLVAAMAHNMAQVIGSSQTIAASAEQLSVTMGVQTREVKDIASAISGVSDAVGAIAGGAGSARDQSTTAGKAAGDGRAVVDQTIAEIRSIESAARTAEQAVGSLRQRGETIGEILKVINDIAEQTNLLALNAAIEAARAGEHGRGFAVVADEVRKLADRTTKATGEIAGVIEQIRHDTSEVAQRTTDSIDRVARGVTQASSAGTSLERIVAQTGGVTEIIAKIADDAHAQSGQVTTVREKAAVVAASITEAEQATSLIAAAAADLSELSKKLGDTLGKFQLDRRSEQPESRRIAVADVASNLGPVVDLSLTGARVRLKRSVSCTVGQEADLVLESRGRTITARAKVAWQRTVSGKPQAGFQFTRVDAEAMRQLIASASASPTRAAPGQAASLAPTPAPTRPEAPAQSRAQRTPAPRVKRAKSAA